MDNEDKVKEVVKTGKLQFLESDKDLKITKPKIYSLEEEFKNAKRNRNILFYVFILEFIAIVVLSSILITIYYQQKSLGISINTSESGGVRLGKLINNSEILSEYKLEEQRQMLIKKYNPTYNENEKRKFLLPEHEINLHKDIKIKKYNNELLNNTYLDRKKHEEIINYIFKQTRIIEYLNTIDYTNSIPDTLSSLDNLSKSIINEYEKIWFDIAVKKWESEKKLAYYNNAMEKLAKSQSVIGFVLDAAKKSKITVFIRNDEKLKAGDLVDVISNGTRIAQLKLYNNENNFFLAETVQINSGSKLSPMDKIIAHQEIKSE